MALFQYHKVIALMCDNLPEITSVDGSASSWKLRMDHNMKYNSDRLHQLIGSVHSRTISKEDASQTHGMLILTGSESLLKLATVTLIGIWYI